MSGLLGLKILSVVMTAGLGIVALLRDFRDKITHKITNPGYATLAGIVIGALLGVVIEGTQMKESERAKQEATEQTLELAKKANKSLDDIQRLLTPIEEPAADAAFHVNCDVDNLIRSYCDSRLHPQGGDLVKDEFKKWPTADMDRFSVSFMFFRDAITVPQSSVFNWRQPDWDFNLITVIDPTDQQKEQGGLSDIIPLSASDTEVKILVDGGKPIWSHSNERFRSVRDFPGSTIMIEINEDQIKYLKPEHFQISFKDGESIECKGPFRLVSFTTKTGHWHAFLYTFPKASLIGSH